MVTRRHFQTRRPAGFTLVEMLVVIGILVVVIGFTVPAVMKALNTGKRTRIFSDLTLIGTALEAYHQDFGDYPRFDDDWTNPSLNKLSNRGAVLLCRSLLGPGPAVLRTGGPVNFGFDGHDGSGFAVRVGGKVSGPYIQGDKFPIHTSDPVNYSDAMLLDNQGNPILYYPATPGQPNFTANGGYVSAVVPTGVGNPPPPVRPLYNAIDNTVGQWKPEQMATQPLLTITDLQTIMGADSTGKVDTAGGKTATYTGPYLLWSAGLDGLFGITAPKNKTDDVTNFDIPVGLR